MPDRLYRDAQKWSGIEPPNEESRTESFSAIWRIDSTFIRRDRFRNWNHSAEFAETIHSFCAILKTQQKRFRNSHFLNCGELRNCGRNSTATLKGKGNCGSAANGPFAIAAGHALPFPSRESPSQLRNAAQPSNRTMSQ